MAMGNFLSLSITVSNAMNRAANGGSPQKAQLEIKTSSVVRPFILVIIYILLFRAELCDPLAAILPLLFAQFCRSNSSTFSARIPRRHKRQRTVIPPHEWSENLLYHPVVRRHRHHTDNSIIVFVMLLLCIAAVVLGSNLQKSGQAAVRCSSKKA